MHNTLRMHVSKGRSQLTYNFANFLRSPSKSSDFRREWPMVYNLFHQYTEVGRLRLHARHLLETREYIDKFDNVRMFYVAHRLNFTTQSIFTNARSMQPLNRNDFH